MNFRKVTLIIAPSLMALVNLYGNLTFMRTLTACAESLTPCAPSKAQVVFSSMFAFPVMLLPISLAYLGFLINAALWASGAYLVLRLTLGNAQAA